MYSTKLFSLLLVDYAFFNKKSQGFKGFIFLIDAYNRFIFVEKIRSIENNELEGRYDALFRRSGTFNTGTNLVLHLCRKANKLGSL